MNEFGSSSSETDLILKEMPVAVVKTSQSVRLSIVAATTAVGGTRAMRGGPCLTSLD